VNGFEKLLRFLTRLEDAKITYRLEHIRDETIMVFVAVPGQYWEVEFFEDGAVEIERFASNGTIEGEPTIEELFSRFSD